MRARERALREDHRHQLGVLPAPIAANLPERRKIRLEPAVHFHRVRAGPYAKQVRAARSRKTCLLARPSEQQNRFGRVESSEAAQRVECPIVAGVGCGGDEHDMTRARGDSLHGLVPLRCDGGLMRFVHDHEIPDLGRQRPEHFGLLDEVDRRNDDRFDGPWIHVERQRGGKDRQR